MLKGLSFVFTLDFLGAVNSMATFRNTLPLLPIFQSPSNLFILMELFEEFTNLCHLNQISFWINSGTELGALRH